MMIRHAPLGSGHPYTDDTDQRSPAIPVAGEELRIGARTSKGVDTVTLSLQQELDDGTILNADLSCGRVQPTGRGKAADSGHLAAAQEGRGASSNGWEGTLTLAPRAVVIRYRLTAVGPVERRSTRLHTADVASWRPAPASTISVAGDAVAVVPGSVAVLATRSRIRRVRFALPLEQGEHVAGFGERYDRLDHRGTELDSRVFEQYKSQGAERRTYMPMPFAHVVGGGGWGFHVQTSRRVWFDVGHSTPDQIIVDVDVDAPEGPEAALGLRVYGGSPAEVLDQFLDDVGRPMEMPEWVFKLWASGNEWNTQAEVERQAELHRTHGIPIGAIVIEAWSDESTFTVWRDAQYTPREDGGPLRAADFTFPPHGAWPDPKGMVERLHDDDVRVILWQIPLIKMRPHPRGQTHHDADAAIRDGYVVQEKAPDGTLRPYRNRGWWFPLGLMPDLTDHRAAEWWTSKRRYLVEEIGVDGFKTDGGEHAWGDDLVYLDGSTGAEANNVFPVAYAQAFGDLLRGTGKDPVTFSRAGFTGSQPHGLFWAGDENSTWDAFRWSMWAGLNAAACGIVYWGWDIAGFSGPIPDPELYLRAFAASAFVPVMQYHSEFNHHRTPSRDRTPWNIASEHADPSVIEEVREIVALRERLIPYLSESARRAVDESKPLMRPLFFEYPDDPGAWTAAPQWLLGDDILVAPVLRPGEEWDLYLPAGKWRDAWTGDQIIGGRLISTRTPRSRVPVYVKNAAWTRLATVFETH